MSYIFPSDNARSCDSELNEACERIEELEDQLASRQALEGEPVAYQYWWPESPRQVTVCKAKDLPSTHPDLIVVPLYTHLSGHCPSCGRSAVRKDCDEVLTPEIEEIREHCNRAMKMEKSNE